MPLSLENTSESHLSRAGSSILDRGNVSEFFDCHLSILKDIRKNLALSQNVQKQQAYNHERKHNSCFEVNVMVLLSTINLPTITTSNL